MSACPARTIGQAPLGDVNACPTRSIGQAPAVIETTRRIAQASPVVIEEAAT